jgi:calcineurin-like phosphoesterase family protein
MAQTFIIADTHFGHQAILRYEDRPFETLEQMDEELIARWNSKVKKEDTVFVLGDFSLYPQKKTEEITRRLKGKKVLIMGNHDTKSPAWYRNCGFYEVSRYPIILEGEWILSHRPLPLNEHMPYYNLYGHVHSNPCYTTYHPKSYCVCVERIDYAPLLFEEIRRRMGL